MYLKSLLLLAALIVVALAIPHGDIEGVRSEGMHDLVLRDPILLGDVQRAHVSSQGPLVVGPTPLIDPQIVAAGIRGLGDITKAVCKNGAVGWQVCVGTALIAVVGIALFSWFGSKRDLPGGGAFEIEWLPGYAPPTVACNFHCTMKAAVPATGALHHFAYVTVNGTRHAMHFAHGGDELGSNLSMVRAVEMGSAADAPGNERRQNHDSEDNEGGVVVDYRFSDLNLGIWDEFNSNEGNSANTFSSLVTNVLGDTPTLVSCANFEDSSVDGVAGVVSAGWNNQAFQFGAGGAASASTYYNECVGVH